MVYNHFQSCLNSFKLILCLFITKNLWFTCENFSFWKKFIVIPIWWDFLLWCFEVPEAYRTTLQRFCQYYLKFHLIPTQSTVACYNSAWNFITATTLPGVEVLSCFLKKSKHLESVSTVFSSRYWEANERERCSSKIQEISCSRISTYHIKR